MSNILVALSSGTLAGATPALFLAYVAPARPRVKRNRYRNVHGQRAAVDRYLSDLRRSV
ncbi:hypothetical protein [Streptomyces sp. NPDC058625]|uniref:hypothetical protein n=1 Tax=Streptomyces sp. NPDC058625 TaxID=3346564 RepID=UPI003666C56E